MKPIRVYVESVSGIQLWVAMAAAFLFGVFCGWVWWA